MTAMTTDLEQALERALQARPPQRVKATDEREAAVLIPIYNQDDPTLIFTVRTETLPSHKGQISFPGGSIDASDPSPEAAALREAEEEIGLLRDDVRVLGELDTTPTYVSGYVIWPFVGWLAQKPVLRPNPAEVAAVLEVPIAALSDDIRREPGFSHSGFTYPTEAWVWEDRVIWGVTARLLRLLLQRLGEAGIATPPGPTKSWDFTPLASSER